MWIKRAVSRLSVSTTSPFFCTSREPAAHIRLRRKREGLRKPRVNVAAARDLVADRGQRLAELILALSAAHAPARLAPLVGREQVAALGAHEPLAQRTVAAELVAQDRAHYWPLPALPVGRQRQLATERVRLRRRRRRADGGGGRRIVARLCRLEGVLDALIRDAAHNDAAREPIRERLPPACERGDGLAVLVSAPFGGLPLERDNIRLQRNLSFGCLPLLRMLI